MNWDLYRKSFPNLSRAKEFSASQLERLSRSIDRLNLDSNLAVVVTGSYGRDEASSSSDLDFFVIRTSSGIKSDGHSRVVEDVSQLSSELGIRSPSTTGAFASFQDADDMVRLIGGKEDQNFTTTCRMTFLLEGKPIYNADAVSNLRKQFLEKYVKNSTTNHQLALFFLNDVIRYYRIVCVDYEFKTDEEKKPWAIRNIKLIFSRKLLYFSGIITAADVAQRSPENKRARINALLGMNPVERIIDVCGDSAIKAISIYDNFIARISETSVRHHLEQLPTEHRDSDSIFRDLKNEGHHFTWALMKLLKDTFEESHPIHRSLVL